MRIAIAAYTLFLIILMVGLFVFGLIILSEWLKIQIPFISGFKCSSLKIKYCEEWKKTGNPPSMKFPENCQPPTYEDCFGEKAQSS